MFGSDDRPRGASVHSIQPSQLRLRAEKPRASTVHARELGWARLRAATCLSACLGVAGAWLLNTPLALAQSNPRQLADANKTAMEYFNNLDIEAARGGLEKAIKNAEKNGIRGPALARTYSNLAVVLVGGLADQQAAAAAFARALEEDPSVEPDPIVATPEVMQAYEAAKSGSVKPAKSDERPVSRTPAAPAEGNLDHTPVPEQLSQTAVPVFVRKSSDIEIDKIKIAYRSTGMAKPRTAELNETDDGFTFLIPCTDVFEPTVEYFLTAVDDDGQTVGNFGTSSAPVSVPIVSVRSEPAPSLPGEVPPSQCSADSECPPGMPGCVQHGSGGLGDTCSSDSDCGAGMVCSDDFCSMGERSSSGDDDDRSSGRKKIGKRLYLDVGIGVAMTAVTKGRSGDRSPLDAVNDVTRRASEGNMPINKEYADQLLTARGWDCATTVTDNNGLRAENCTVAVNPGGIVAVPVINLAAGMFVTPSLALALTGRFQIGHGEGPLAGILVGGRGEYYLTRPSAKGLKFGLLAGFGVGQMQARPPADSSAGKSGPYATNANPGGVGLVVNAGSRIAYMFMPGLGLNLTPTMNFGLPNFLFSLDLTAGVSAAF